MRKILFLFILLILLTACAKQQENNSMAKKIRQPAVAGQFYPAEPDKLKAEIEQFLNQATSSPLIGEIKAVIVPHAGYDYSAPVAAYSYKNLIGKKFARVLLIGNSHNAYFDGVAIDDNDIWQTPLGSVAVDRDLAKKLTEANSRIKFNNSAHLPEHSLEVQIPFLQTVLAPGFKIVPILFGNTQDDFYKDLAKVLADNLGPNDLIVVSSDMSHYPSYNEASRIDPVTLEKIKTLDVAQLTAQVNEVISQDVADEDTLLCGIDAVKTIMELAKLQGWQAEILRYANSGDVAGIGDKNRVVGYGAVAFAKIKNEKQKIKNNELNKEQQNVLLKIAEDTVQSFVTNGTVPQFNITDERLNQQQGVFVTLYKNGLLRGCIGQIEPSDKPLYEVVRDMAVAAASQDQRFSPVTKDELPGLRFEVSVLSVPERIDDWRKIQLGRDGVIIRKGFHSGVFLPQVATETGWSLEEFLAQLCWQKAGLAPDDYKSKEAELKVFTAQVFSSE